MGGLTIPFFINTAEIVIVCKADGNCNLRYGEFGGLKKLFRSVQPPYQNISRNAHFKLASEYFVKPRAAYSKLGAELLHADVLAKMRFNKFLCRHKKLVVIGGYEFFQNDIRGAGLHNFCRRLNLGFGLICNIFRRSLKSPSVDTLFGVGVKLFVKGFFIGLVGDLPKHKITRELFVIVQRDNRLHKPCVAFVGYCRMCLFAFFKGASVGIVAPPSGLRTALYKGAKSTAFFRIGYYFLIVRIKKHEADSRKSVKGFHKFSYLLCIKAFRHKIRPSVQIYHFSNGDIYHYTPYFVKVKI